MAGRFPTVEWNKKSILSIIKEIFKSINCMLYIFAIKIASTRVVYENR